MSQGKKPTPPAWQNVNLPKDAIMVTLNPDHSLPLYTATWWDNEFHKVKAGGETPGKARMNLIFATLRELRGAESRLAQKREEFAMAVDERERAYERLDAERLYTIELKWIIGVLVVLLLLACGLSSYLLWGGR